MKPGSQPRPVTTSDREAWFEAASARGIDTPDLLALRAYVARRSPRRWRRFQRDSRHIGKIIAKIGMNPEDAKWLL